MTSIERLDPPLVADEAAMLLAFLDYHRDTLRMKTTASPPSSWAGRSPPPR